MNESITLNAFGRILKIVRSAERWQVLLLSADGKSRPTADIVVPAHLTLAEIPPYVDDLLHESATPENPSVQVIEATRYDHC
jgi:hypothetical protein